MVTGLTPVDITIKRDRLQPNATLQGRMSNMRWSLVLDYVTLAAMHAAGDWPVEVTLSSDPSLTEVEIVSPVLMSHQLGGAISRAVYAAYDDIMSSVDRILA